MADKVEGDTTAGRSQTAIAKPERSKSKRKAELATITEDLTGKFLRVGNRLFRASDDKTPTIRIEPNRRKGYATLRKSRHCGVTGHPGSRKATVEFSNADRRLLRQTTP